MLPLRTVGRALVVAAAACASSAATVGAQPPAESTAPAAARPDDEIERPEVRALDIRGVEAVDEEALRSSIATTASSCNSLLYRLVACPFTKSATVYTRRYLDREEFRRDVLRIRVFYWLRGYRAASVDTLVRQLAPDAVAITIAVREGPPTTVAQVEVAGVDSLLPPERRERLLQVREGEPFSLIELDSSVVAVRDALWDLGYADATVDTATATDTTARTATVRLLAEPGPLTIVGPIRVQGLEALSAMTVRNSLTLREGEVFEREALFRSQRNLYESGLFRRATIEPAAGDSVKPITITVREADLQSVRLSGGFNTIDFVQVDGRYTHRNLGGGARRLTLSATVGNLLARQLEDRFVFQRAVDPSFQGDADPFLLPSWVASAELRQPWFRSPENTIAASIFAHRRVTPLVVVDRGQGATATFTREFAPRANLSASYRFETTRIEAGDVYFCVNFGVCDLATIATLTGTQRLSPLVALGTIDQANDPLGPTQGYRARVELEHASGYTGSTYRYNRGVVEGAAYRPILGGTLAGHARVGRTWALQSSVTAPDVDPLFGADVIHPRKRFYAGGSRSVRGYGEGQLGPRALTIAPNRLRGLRQTDDGPVYLRCEPGIPIAQCPLDFGTDSSALEASDFTPRPLGSPAVAEVNVEYRRTVWGPLSLALFVDAAVLPAGDDAFFTLDDNFMAVTPGFGVRYQSPVGPIRVDVGINPGGPEALPVFTQVEEMGERRIVQVGQDLPPGERPRVVYDPVGEASSWFRRTLNRMVLHLSIGEAF